MRKLKTYFAQLGCFALMIFVGLSTYKELSYFVFVGVMIVCLAIAYYAATLIGKNTRADGSLKTGYFTRYDSPDLDHIIIEPGRGVNIVSPEELTKKINQNQFEPKKCRINVFGDLPFLRESFNIKKASYQSSEDVLSLFFEESICIQFKMPRYIYEAGSYFKILKAKEVRIYNTQKEELSISYIKLPSKKPIQVLDKWNFEGQERIASPKDPAIYLKRI